MRKRRATGRPSRLTADQIQEIRKMYEQGARAWGFASDRWTTGRLAEAIQRGFGIHYDCDHVGRLMHNLLFIPGMPPVFFTTLYLAMLVVVLQGLVMYPPRWWRWKAQAQGRPSLGLQG